MCEKNVIGGWPQRQLAARIEARADQLLVARRGLGPRTTQDVSLVQLAEAARALAVAGENLQACGAFAENPQLAVEKAFRRIQQAIEAEAADWGREDPEADLWDVWDEGEEV